MGWLKLIEMHQLTVLETGSLKSRHYGAMLPLRPVREILLCLFPAFCDLLAIFGGRWPAAA